MKTKFLFSGLFLFLIASVSFGQKSNSEKILGCWVLKKMVYLETTPDSPKLSEEAMNSYVCFDKDGSFITRLGGHDSDIVKGKYQLSTDGKKLSQSRDEDEEGIDEEAEITVLDDKQLELKLEFGVMYFERK